MAPDTQKTDEEFTDFLMEAEDNDDEQKPDDAEDEAAEEAEAEDEAEENAEEDGAEDEDEDEEQEDEDEEAEEEPREKPVVTDDTPVKIRWNRGEPEEEITIGELREGALRWKDYTQKTTELSEERERMRAEHMDNLAQWAIQPEQEPDWGEYARLGYDPAVIFQAQSEWKRKQAVSEEARHQWEALRAEQEQEAEAERAQKAQNEIQALLDVAPEFADSATRPAAMARIQRAAEVLGYSNDELMGIEDHRMIRGLMLIAQQLDSEEIKPAIAKKVAEATSKSLPKKARRNRVDKKALQKQARSRLKKEGSENAFADFLMSG